MRLPVQTGQKALMVASTGGHLSQMDRIDSRYQFRSDSLWITFRNPQSLSMLASRRVVFIPYVAPRDVRSAAAALRHIVGALRGENFDLAVSTGASVAGVALPVARLMGVPAHYVESVSRVNGPSLTGRILANLPGIQMYTQHKAYADRRWTPIEPVLADYETVPGGQEFQIDTRRPRVFVTLGTIQPYRFDRLVDNVLSTFPPDSEFTWQLGCTSRLDLPGVVTELVDAKRFDQEVLTSDIVVTHAGVGSIMRVLELGRPPIVAARRRSAGEHVDDHQEQILQYLEESKLTVGLDSPWLDWEANLDFLRSRVVPRSSDNAVE